MKKRKVKKLMERIFVDNIQTALKMLGIKLADATAAMGNERPLDVIQDSISKTASFYATVIIKPKT